MASFNIIVKELKSIKKHKQLREMISKTIVNAIKQYKQLMPII